MIGQFYKVHQKRFDNYFQKRRPTHAIFSRQAMEQFAQTAEELRSTMDGIRESISAVNIAVEESAKGIAGVSESSVQLTGNVNDIQSEASDNNGIAEDLATEVGKFKLE